MKTVTEVHEWRQGVADEFGDPAAAVGLLFARFRQLEMIRAENEVTVSWDGLHLVLAIGRSRIPLQIDVAGARFSDSGNELEAFGIDQVAPGLWSLGPSLNMPQTLHVFVILYDVPSPAPWERLLVDQHGAPLG